MPVDVEALKLREIDRAGQFTPIQFGDIAKAGIGTAQQFIAGQEQNQALQQKRKQAAQMQQLLNGGANAVLQTIGQLEPEDQKLIFGGDANTISSLASTQEGLVNVWKRVAEVQASRAGEAAPTFGEKVTEFGKRGTITPKEQLEFQKPAEGKTDISIEIKNELLTRTLAFSRENGRPPNSAEQGRINAEVAEIAGVPDTVVSPIAQQFVKQAEKPGTQQNRVFKQGQAQIKQIEKFGKDLQSSAEQGQIFNDIAESIDLFGDSQKGLINSQEFDTIRAKFADVTPENLISAFITEKLGANPKTKEQAALLKRVRRDAKVSGLLESGEFANLVTRLSKLVNIITKDRSGAAVTANELERLKTEFGIDLLGSPQQLKIGLINYGDNLKFSMEQIERRTSPEAVNTFRKRGGFTSFDLSGVGTQSVTPQLAPTPQDSTVQRDTLDQEISEEEREIRELEGLE
jgi:hypothetical protein